VARTNIGSARRVVIRRADENSETPDRGFPQAAGRRPDAPAAMSAAVYGSNIRDTRFGTDFIDRNRILKNNYGIFLN
jgi:hypothetical protein